MIRAGWWWLVLAAGCAAPVSAPPPIELPGGAGPLDRLTRQFGRLRGRMEARGYGPAVASTRAFVLEGEAVAFPLDLPRGECTTVVAIGGGSLRDLDAELYDGDGRTVAEDVGEGEGVLLHACPAPGADDGPSAPHYLVLQAVRGTGAAVAGAFVSSPGRGRGFEALFEGVLAPTVPFEDVLAALATATGPLRERGLRPVAEPRVSLVAEGGTQRLTAGLEGDRCYVGLALGGAGVTDVDLFLFDAHGAELARDLGADAEPRVEHCTTELGEATLEARVFEGGGAVAMQLFGGVGRPVPAPEAPVAAESFEPLPWLLQEANRLAAREYGEPQVIVRDAEVTGAEVQKHELVVGPGCHVILGAGGPGEMDLDLYLTGRADGQLLDSDTRIARTARLSACRTEREILEITVKAYGRGRYGLMRVPAPPTVGDVASLRLEPLVDGARAAGLTPAGAPPERVAVSAGQTLERTLELVPGRCVSALVAGGAGIDDVDLLLRDQEGNLVASDTGPAPWATLQRCAGETGAGRFDLEIRVYRGQGDIVLQWLENHI